jgi:hypothetical protein
MPDAPAAPVAPPATFEDFVKATPSLAKFKTPVDLAKSYVELEKGFGKRIPIPENDDPQAWDEIYSKLGRPESPDKYSRLDPKVNPEGVEVDPTFMDDFYKMAHSKGLTNRQANDLLQDIYGRAGAKSKEMSVTEQQEAEANETALNQLFGVNRPKVEEQIKRILGERVPLADLESRGFFKDPVMMKLAHALTREYVEDHAITKPDHRNLGTEIPADIERRKNELMKSPEYLKGKQEAVDAVYGLNKLLAQAKNGNKVLFETLKR